MDNQFHVGQLVKMKSYSDATRVRFGDLGTVVGYPAEPTWTDVLWHRSGHRFPIRNIQRCPYQHPMDAPGRSVGAGNTVRALTTCINMELPNALEEVTRDLERARMEKEYVVHADGD